MEYHSTPAMSALRRFAAALMIFAVVVASLGSTARELAFGPVVAKISVAELVKPHAGVPKPCRSAVLPGAVNTCPLASLALTGFPTTEPGQTVPDAPVHALLWRIMNSRLPAQCGGPSPYRPPCPIV